MVCTRSQSTLKIPAATNYFCQVLRQFLNWLIGWPVISFLSTPLEYLPMTKASRKIQNFGYFFRLVQEKVFGELFSKIPIIISTKLCFSRKLAKCEKHSLKQMGKVIETIFYSRFGQSNGNTRKYCRMIQFLRPPLTIEHS